MPAELLTIRAAEPRDRPAIYRMRHAVYASELGQHPENAEGVLTDALDEFNEYLVACRGGELAGFVSVTPPGRDRYSVDKYLPRGAFPFPFDDRLYEVRLLTVAPAFRTGPVTPLLMHAALRRIDERGGSQIVALGRREVVGLYEKAGFRSIGRQVRSGAVTYEVMAAEIGQARRHAAAYRGALRRWLGGVEWRLPFAALEADECEHGGAFFGAIGEDFRTLERRHSVINADVLDAWFPPAPAVAAVLREHLEWAARTSPPTRCGGLVRAIAEARGLPPECLALGGGSSALIYTALREWLGPGSRVLVLDPMYGEYLHLFERVIGCRVDRLRLDARDSYRVDPAALEERCRGGYDLVVLVNPNNPTGRHIPRGELEPLLRRAPPGTRFWIDEAYVDYVGPGESLERFAAASGNVVVCKSMSKAYALSGLRAAYLAAPEPLARSLRAITPPWAIGLPAQMAAVLALDDPAYYGARYDETGRYREGFADALRGIGVEVTPGTANFLLCRLPRSGPDAATVLGRCRSAGLFFRDVRAMGTRLGRRVFRTAVKDAETNARIVETLTGALRR